MKHSDLRLFGAEVGREFGQKQLEALDRYSEWLASEAIPAGGIGPHEQSALQSRHVLDSLTFLACVVGDPETALDLGSGVGLPGIPLAIALPKTRFTLLDRSAKRRRLIERAIRVVDLSNVTTESADIAEYGVRHDLVVSRASLPPEALLEHLHRIVIDRGIVAGSTQQEPSVSGYESKEIRSMYLNGPRWLLIMTP